MNNKRYKKRFTVVEFVIVMLVATSLIVLLISFAKHFNAKSNNSGIVNSMTLGAAEAITLLGSVDNICDEFEQGGSSYSVRKGIEDMGGIWNCDAQDQTFRMFVKLNQKAVLAQDIHPFTPKIFADSKTHRFGHFYCLNSLGDKNFTHWSAYHFAYPSCNDADFVKTPRDPVNLPTPTFDPFPESDPSLPLGENHPCPKKESKVCHFGQSICVSKKAQRAHLNHKDTLGPC